MNSSTSSSDRLRRVFGLLAWPLAAALMVLGLHEIGNRMVNASTRLGARVAEVQAAGVGEVVIFGNSIARKALDLKRLGDVFAPTKRASSFASDGNNLPHWYALLVGEVYERGHRPEVIVIYANKGVHGLTIMETPEAEADFFGLRASSHPLLVENYFQGKPQAQRWQRIQASRFQLREALLDGVVERGTAAFMGIWLDSGGGTRGYARQELEMASQSILFSPDAQAKRTVLPNQNQTGDRKGIEKERDEPTLLLSGLLPHFVALAQTYGARTVLVRAPMHPRVRPLCSARTGLDHFVESLGGLPVDVVDLSYLHIPSEHFTSSSHLKPVGQPMATDALAQALIAVNAFDGKVDRPTTGWEWPCSAQSDQQVSLTR